MLTIDLDGESNPLIVADAVGIFISDGLRAENISLYSAFLLNQDVLRLRRRGYRQPAWQSALSLSGVLALYMQYLFGMTVGETSIVRTVALWLEEDTPLLGEHREHYIRNILTPISAIDPSEEQLIKLSEIRSKYMELSGDDGPYHTEVFPYDYYSPEDVLLGQSGAAAGKGQIEPDVEELMLALAEWG